MVPDDLLYTSEHTWIKADGIFATFGITDFAQSNLGDVVFVDLPAVGEKILAGDNMGSIETTNTVNPVTELHAPVNGEVFAVNDDLEHSPELVNQDPYGTGWIAVIELSNPEDLTALLTPKQYALLIENI